MFCDFCDVTVISSQLFQMLRTRSMKKWYLKSVEDQSVVHKFIKSTQWLSLAAAAVDAWRDDDDVSGRIVLVIVVVGCGSSERMLSLCHSTWHCSTYRHRRVLVDGARQPRLHVRRQLTGDPSVPPETS